MIDHYAEYRKHKRACLKCLSGASAPCALGEALLREATNAALQARAKRERDEVS